MKALLNKTPWLRAVVSGLATTGLLMVMGMMLGGCEAKQIFNGTQTTMKAYGPVAQRQLEIFYVTLYVVVGIFIAVAGALLYAVLRFRQKEAASTSDSLPPQTHGNTVMELGLSLVSVSLLVIIAVPTVQGIFFCAESPDVTEKPAINMRVTGNQWWWNFEYKDLGLTVANEMHIPVGHPINFELFSADVIHSFWVPALGGKTDVIPGQLNHMWFQADKPGLYYGQCTEFCGESHALMRFRVIADSEADFDKWLTAQKADVNPAAATSAPEGEKIAEEKCITCHTIRGSALNGTIGPDLTHLVSRGTFAAGLLKLHDSGATEVSSEGEDNLRKWISHPQEIKPGAKMTLNSPHRANVADSIQISDDEVTKVIAYLKNLK